MQTNLIKKQWRLVLFLYLHNYVQKSLFQKITRQTLLEVDQVKLVYFLSLVIGLLSALAAALLKYSIHYIHKILTQGITSEPGTYLYLAFPLIGMFLTFMFVKFIVRIISATASAGYYFLFPGKGQAEHTQYMDINSCKHFNNRFWRVCWSWSTDSINRFFNRIRIRQFFKLNYKM